MTVIASGEIDLKLSPKSLAALDNSLAKTSNAARQRLEKDLGQAGASGGAAFSKGFAGKLSGVKGAIGNALSGIGGQQIAQGVAVVGTAIAAFAAKSIAHFQNTALSVRAFQRVTGQTAEEASHFVAAFDDMGISAEKASGAMFKLAKNIGSGGKSLTDLGIGIEHSNRGAVDLQGTFLNVADAIAKTPDPAKRAEIAVAAFGKTGASLLPILEKGRAGIEKLFAGADLNFSQKQLDSAEDYRLAMDHLGDSVGKVQNRIGGALVPSLAKASEGLAVVIDKTLSATENSSLLGEGLGLLADTAVPGIRGVVGVLGLLSDGSDDAKLSTDQLVGASSALGVSLDILSDKTKDQVAAMLEEKKVLDGLRDATFAQFDANFAYRESLDANEDAAKRVAEAQAALNETLTTHTRQSPEAQAAFEAVSRAVLGQEEAALRGAEAAGRLAEQNAKLALATDTTIPKLDAQITELGRARDQIAGAGGNTAAIQGMIDKLNAIREEYKTSVTVDTSAAQNALNGLKRALDAIFARSSRTPSVRLPGEGGPVRLPGESGLGFAGGGLPPRGKISWVGERGPEPLFLPHGGRIISHEDAMAAITAAAAGGGGTVNQYITVNEVAADPQATAFAVARILGEKSQRG